MQKYAHNRRDRDRAVKAPEVSADLVRPLVSHSDVHSIIVQALVQRAYACDYMLMCLQLHASYACDSMLLCA